MAEVEAGKAVEAAHPARYPAKDVELLDMSRHRPQSPEVSYTGQTTPSYSGPELSPATPSSSRPGSAFIAALPPPDEGYAWIFLAASFVIEMLAFGFTFAIGVFHEYWTQTLFPQPQAAATITIATTLCSGLMYITAVVVGPVFTRFPQHRAKMQYGGLALSVAGIIGTAFAKSPAHLIIFAGLMYPIGGCTYYLPAATLLFTWWQRKRGFASGIMYAGTGIGGATFPFIIQSLLNHFSYKAAVISLALGYGLFGVCAVYFVRERIPVTKRSQGAMDMASRRVPTDFVKRNTFYAFNATILLTSLGNFLPSIYLPSYATDLGLSQSKGTLLVTLMNASSVAGLLIFGYLCDQWPAKVVLAVSCLGSAASCFLLWGLATHLSVLIIFALVFGFFALGFAATWSTLITIVCKDDPVMLPIVFSIFACTRGIGNILSGPISNALLQHGTISHAKLGYGVENYGGLLLWTGGVIALGSVTGVVWKDA